MTIPEKDFSIINAVGVIASVFTLVGFYITIKQIQSVKEIAIYTEGLVNKKLNGYNRIIFVSEVSSKISIVSDVKSYLRNNNLEMCVFRMEDIKRVLAGLRSNAHALGLELDAKEFGTINRNFTIDMINIQKKLLDENYNINSVKIIENMENLSQFLLNIEGSLKQTKANHE